LWLYLARTRAGDQSAATELAANAQRLKPADWPYAVVELYLGHSTPEATLAAPGKPDERCEAQFYIGAWQLMRADRPAAIESLKTAVSTCPKDFVEATDARAELKRLGQ
jgi:lipoprotein NlpI